MEFKELQIRITFKSCEKLYYKHFVTYILLSKGIVENVSNVPVIETIITWFKSDSMLVIQVLVMKIVLVDMCESSII